VEILAIERPGVLITYDGLPLSAGGAHRLRRKDRAAIWKSMLHFLNVFTTYREPDEVRWLLHEGLRVDRAFFAKAHRVATTAFGRPQRRLAITGQVEEYEHRWVLAPDEIDEALGFMQALEPFPEHWLGAPLVLSVNATFRLRDPDSGDPFPSQDPQLYGNQEGSRLPLGLSAIYLRLTTQTTCGLFLSLPFPEITPALATFVERVDQALPFRLSKKHWSRWQLNAQGTRYYNRRIAVLDSG
jgi:hypothetical protein